MLKKILFGTRAMAFERYSIDLSNKIGFNSIGFLYLKI
jgi:hypothetical protein